MNRNKENKTEEDWPQKSTKGTKEDRIEKSLN